MVPSIKLTYFDIEGIAESIRLALTLTNTDYEDHRISFAEWPSMKHTMPYQQLPVMTLNDGHMLPQSKALLRWVGTEYSDTLYPPDKLLEIEEAIGVMEDLLRAWQPAFQPYKVGYPDGYFNTDEGKGLTKKFREHFVRNDLPLYLTYISSLLKKNDGKWLASKDGPTIADCYAIPILRTFTNGFLDYIPVTCLDKSPDVVDYIKRFCALEPVKGRYSKGIY
jgi:prostaglandin-H2 D-isomerase / glutathione transferase